MQESRVSGFLRIETLLGFTWLSVSNTLRRSQTLDGHNGDPLSGRANLIWREVLNAGCDATVDRDSDALDVPRAWRAQEGHRIGDVIRCPQSTDPGTFPVAPSDFALRKSLGCRFLANKLLHPLSDGCVSVFCSDRRSKARNLLSQLTVFLPTMSGRLCQKNRTYRL